MASRKLVLLILSLLLGLMLSTSPRATIAGERHALLIGCSKYSSESIRELVGAANDVESFHNLLRDQLEFKNVVTLVGWPDDASKRPTYANICAAFEQLVRDADEDSQVFILMSGHGFRFPLPEAQADILDPLNPEPDGLDEAFLPADYHAGQNMILDNQIGKWLDQLKAKKSHVWIIFDSCFSGSMNRSETQEEMRGLTTSEAGISPMAIKAAQDRATKALKGNAVDDEHAVEGLGISVPQNDQGTVVAFYAAQDFETAPEVTRPIGENVSDPRFKHGLLSYHLEQLLRNMNGQTTYADLGRALVSRYRADGRRNPTPYWEGDLSIQVLGRSKWPLPTPIFLEKFGNSVRLNGGQLAGVIKDAIVAVYLPEDKDFMNPLGHLLVTAVSPTAASVEPVAFGEQKLIPFAQLPENGICRIVSRNLGGMAIKLEVLSTDGSSACDESFSAAIQKESEATDAVFQLSKAGEQADWSLVFLSPEAAAQFGMDSKSAAAILMSAANASDLLQRLEKVQQTPTQLLSESPYSLYSSDVLADPSKLASYLSDDLRRIHTWHNVWKLAGEFDEPVALGARPDKITLESRLIGADDDTSPGDPLTSSRLSPGTSVLLKVVNTSYQPHWYSVFYLSGRFAIQHVKTDSIAGRNFRKAEELRIERDVMRFTIEPNSYGANGFVVIAVAQKEHTHRPDFQFLAQSRLGGPLSRAFPDTSSLKTPFDRLLLESLGGHRERFRSGPSPDSPQIASWSWVVAPPESSISISP